MDLFIRKLKEDNYFIVVDDAHRLATSQKGLSKNQVMRTLKDNKWSKCRRKSRSAFFQSLSLLCFINLWWVDRDLYRYMTSFSYIFFYFIRWSNNRMTRHLILSRAFELKIEKNTESRYLKIKSKMMQEREIGKGV